MLAQTILSAKELGLSEEMHGALVKLLGMFERGEIPKEKFTMWSVGKPTTDPECGTAGCILGWASGLLGVNALPHDKWLEWYEMHKTDWQSNRLFYPSFDGSMLGYHANTTQAARALRNYLSTGKPKWLEVMAD